MNTSSPWLWLLVAGFFEVVWASGLKSTQGFTRLLPSVWVGLAMAASLYGLSVAIEGLPVGTAYAVWTGIGAAGTALVGIFLLGESAAPARVACIFMIVAGTVGLKLFSRG